MTAREERRLFVAVRRLEEAAVNRYEVENTHAMGRKEAEKGLRKARTWLREVVSAIEEEREPARYGTLTEEEG